MGIVLKTLEWKQLSDRILSCSKNVRFVGIMDYDGNVISKHSLPSADVNLIKDIEMFDVDQLIIKNIQSVFDDALGIVHHMEIYRELVSEIIHYVDNHIIFITINTDIEENFHTLSLEIKLLLKKEILE